MTTKRKILTGVIVVLVMAAAVLMIPLTTLAAMVTWVYLVWNIRKKGISLFHEQMEPEIVAKRYKILKTSLTVAAVSVVAGITGAVSHNVLYAVGEEEDAVTFIIALATLWLFIVLTGVSLVIYLTGRRKPITSTQER